MNDSPSADEKAFHLFYSKLSQVQREQWHQSRTFLCVGSETKTLYEVVDYGVCHTIIHNVLCRANRTLLGSYTYPFQSPHSLPPYDNLTIKKMYIENLEDDFLLHNCIYQGVFWGTRQWDQHKKIILSKFWQKPMVPDYIRKVIDEYEGPQLTYYVPRTWSEEPLPKTLTWKQWVRTIFTERW
jgi:hypothetical protein